MLISPAAAPLSSEIPYSTLIYSFLFSLEPSPPGEPLPQGTNSALDFPHFPTFNKPGITKAAADVSSMDPGGGGGGRFLQLMLQQYKIPGPLCLSRNVRVGGGGGEKCVVQQTTNKLHFNVK